MHLDQRCAALGQAGADTVIVLETTHDFLQMTPEAFVRHVLLEKLKAAAVVEGDNFFFGHNRAGNVQILAQMGKELGFQVEIAKPVMVEFEGKNVRISSSLIRQLVTQGQVEHAALGLGRPYTMRGRVFRDRGRGRAIGFPTANLDCGLQLMPADGVYAGRGLVGHTEFLAAISVGTRPSFGQLGRALEAYLLDFTGQDLYDAAMDVQFAQRLRGQLKFDSIDALKTQMVQDIQHVRELLQ